MTSIVGFGMTRFGKRDEDLISLAVESSQVISAKYSDSIDLVLVSNSYSGEYTGLSGLSDHVCSSLSIDGTPSMRVDNTSVSPDFLSRSESSEAIMDVDFREGTEVIFSAPIIRTVLTYPLFIMEFAI